MAGQVGDAERDRDRWFASPSCVELPAGVSIRPVQKVSDYDDIMKPLMAGDLEALEEIALIVDSFPGGRDDFISRHWITNAIDCGTMEVVAWMLSKQVPVVFRDDEGFTVLHSAIDREKPDRIEIIRMLLEAGADVDARGINDYTPAHHAAIRNDVEALRLLVESGADLSLRTRIDEYATPLEEAKMMGGATEAVAYLQSIRQGGANESMTRSDSKSE